ncbi:DUF6114 domain-containing protein [Microbacterium horticulturae]|uniref:DUF6114 domain-containing protein n=1 Tax=Microbacterium horticulturae TaxID=3028316 RepID=A0ABY8C1J7_9MICO|nr:DUF6114 domain-containing protein [Microbacterium sp. KACC 23027]WEG08713.1 DUF6114 domain-containing protein [Microbacterium sp. KACC 23027]
MTSTAWSRFVAWCRRRPFIGGVLVMLSGVEMFFSGQLDLGHIRVQLGIEGFQATVIPIALVLLGALAVAMPAHHIFYGVLALVVAVYSLVGVNLGGFVLGMLLGCVGGVMVVAWMPRAAKRAKAEAGAAGAGEAGAGAGEAGAGAGETAPTAGADA